MAAISYGIMFAPEVVWDPLTEAQKENLCNYLNKINEHPLPVCNWILFAVLVNIAMKKVGRRYSPEMLEEYLEGLDEQEQSERSPEELFKLLSQGDVMAQAELSQRYLRAAAEMAVEMNCEEIFLEDLVQEANISLLMALGEKEPAQKDETWLLGRIRAGIRHAIEEQTQRKFEDDYLVAKVEKLEAAVRELTEDEDEESSKFSVEELAIILDMDEEEIRDVLRLTGDDK